MRLPRSALLVAALAGLVLPLGAAEAQAGFVSPADPLADAPGLNLGPDPVDVDGAGNATMVWNQNGAGESRVVKARRVTAAGLAGPVLDVSVTDGISQGPAVASTTAGRSFVAWRTAASPGENNGVAGRWMEPDGSLGPVLTLVEGGPAMTAAALSAVVDPAGVATVVWKNDMAGGGLNARRVAPTGGLGALVEDFSNGAVTTPVAVALPDGSTLAAWRAGGPQAGIVSPDGTPGSPMDLSSAGDGGDVALAVDAEGSALAAWRSAADEDWEVRARRISPTGALLGNDLVVDPAAEPFVGSRVSVAADSDGDFIVGWTRQSGTMTGYARRVAMDGSFAGPAQIVSGGGGEVGGIQAALEDRGSAAAAWYLEAGGNYLSQGRVLDALAVPAGGVAELLPGASSVAVAGNPALGISAFVSEAGKAGGAAIALSRFMVPPLCSDRRVRVAEGAPIELALPCSGPGIEGAQVIAQPAHGKLELGGGALAYTPKPGYEGEDSFGFAAFNDAGASNTATVQIDVRKDTVRPRITRFRVKRRKGGAIRLKLRYSEPATAKVLIQRRVKGKRWLKVGRLKAKRLRTSATIKLPRKLRKRLTPRGRFRARAVARDAAGNSSKPKLRRLRLGTR